MSKGNNNAATSAKKRGQMYDVWRHLKRNKGAMLGLAIVVLLILMTSLSSRISPTACSLLPPPIPSAPMKWAAISWRESSTAPA